MKKARALFAAVGQEQRGCLVGAVFSVARYRRIREEALAECPFCSTPATPDWEHLAWNCAHFAAGRPAVPLAELATRRMGWPREHATEVADAEVLEHLGRVRKAVRKHSGFQMRAAGR